MKTVLADLEVFAINIMLITFVLAGYDKATNFNRTVVALSKHFNKLNVSDYKFMGYEGLNIKCNAGKLTSQYGIGLNNNYKSVYSPESKSAYNRKDVFYFHKIPEEITGLQMKIAHKIRTKKKLFGKWEYIDDEVIDIKNGTSIAINTNTYYVISLKNNEKHINTKSKFEMIWFSFLKSMF